MSASPWHDIRLTAKNERCSSSASSRPTPAYEAAQYLIMPHSNHSGFPSGSACVVLFQHAPMRFYAPFNKTVTHIPAHPPQGSHIHFTILGYNRPIPN